MISRFFFEIAYNGTDFFGWQKQPNQISVQEEIELVFQKLNSNTAISIVGCGRTDTGVHAHHYIFHVDLEDSFLFDNIVFKMNRMLPASITVYKYWQVETDHHARFSAKARTYRYFINLQKNPFKQDTSWYLNQSLHFNEMNEAALILLGKQDFTSLSKVNTDVKTNICTISKAQWIQQDEFNWYFEIVADRFLRNMVRATVGTLIDVGLSKIKPNDLKTILQQKDRGAASSSVPAHGLFLWKVEY